MNKVAKQLHPLHKALHRYEGPMNKADRGRVVRMVSAESQEQDHVFLIVVENPTVWRRELKANGQDPDTMIDAALQYGDETKGLTFLPLDALPEASRKPWREAVESQGYELARLHSKEREL